MAQQDGIPKGPETFEHLLACAKLSDREAQAVRSVVLGMTAQEAALIIGVSPSTVGSYRQRAYRKLGVLDKAEFLRLPSVVAWQEGPNGVSAEARACSDSGEANKKSNQPDHVPGGRAKSLGAIFVLSVLASFLLINAFLAVRVLVGARATFATEPTGIISSEFGEVANVAGMRADRAAEVLAHQGYYPRFEGKGGSAVPGKVLSVESIASIDGVGDERSSMSWGDGCTAVYESGGSWRAVVTLVVAV